MISLDDPKHASESATLLVLYETLLSRILDQSFPVWIHSKVAVLRVSPVVVL